MNRFGAYLMILSGILFSIKTCCKVFIRIATCDLNVQKQHVLHVELTERSINEPRSEKTGLRGFRPGPTQTGLYSHRRWLEA